MRTVKPVATTAGSGLGIAHESEGVHFGVLYCALQGSRVCPTKDSLLSGF